jgi:hypothetical protein
MKWDKDNFKINDSKGFFKILLGIGVAGLLISIPFAISDKESFFYSYLTSFMFWITIALGTLFWLLIHNLTNSKWSVVLRRIWENIAVVIPFMAILFIPILIGLPHLYRWADKPTELKNTVRYMIVDGDLKKADPKLVQNEEAIESLIDKLDGAFAGSVHHDEPAEHGDKKEHSEKDAGHGDHLQNDFAHVITGDELGKRYETAVYHRAIIQISSDILITGDLEKDKLILKNEYDFIYDNYNEKVHAALAKKVIGAKADKLFDVAFTADELDALESAVLVSLQNGKVPAEANSAVKTKLLNKHLNSIFDQYKTKSHLLDGKKKWLNSGRFITAVIICFLIWSIIAFVLRKYSLKQDQGFVKKDYFFIKSFSGPCLVLFALSFTCMAFDWLMSLNPYWFSTIWGLYVFSGSVLAFLSFSIIVLSFLRKNQILTEKVTTEHFHDLGKLTFGFIVFWTYISFSQLILQWYGNIPEETIFILMRWENGNWKAISILIIFGHFIIPFLALMTRPSKRNIKYLTFVAVWILIIHYIDLKWMILPNLGNPASSNFSITIADVSSFVGIGGIFLAVFWHFLTSNPIVPVKDPFLKDSAKWLS